MPRRPLADPLQAVLVQLGLRQPGDQSPQIEVVVIVPDVTGIERLVVAFIFAV